MDRRIGWLLACAVPAAAACALAVAVPALDPVSDAVTGLAGLLTALALLALSRTGDPSAPPWRVLAAAALFPVLGLVLTSTARPDPVLSAVVLRWLPTVPGYVLVVVALLGMVERSSLRRTCPRTTLELALFGVAALAVMQFLLVGPGNSWSALSLGAQLVLGAAVVAAAATMAAGLTVLGAVEAHRRRMAAVLLGGLVLLCAARGAATSATLLGAHDVVPVTRVAVVVGLAVLVLARLLDPGTGPDVPRRAADGRTDPLRSVLPHLALVAVVALVVVSLALGTRPTAVTLAGALACVGLAAAHRWVTAHEDHRRGARLRRDEAYFRNLLHSGRDAVLVLDGRLRVGWVSPAMAALVGATPAELLGRDVLSGAANRPGTLEPADAAALRRVLGADAGAGTDAGTDGLVTLHVRDAGGARRCLEASVSDLRADPAVASVVLHCRDVTERVARERALEELAFTDALTGLPNRAGWDAALEPATARAGSAVLLLEVAGLDEVREHAGRDAVAAVLVELGRRLRAAVRGDEVVARLVGGTFAVLAEGDGDTAALLADRCLAVLEQPVTTAAGVFDLTAAVGVVVVEPGTGAAEVGARAELAVAAARASRSARATCWTPALGAAAARRDRLRADLPGAAGRGELWLAFQPVVSMADKRVSGVEALLRWRHPELGEVPPREFVPIAERAGVIGELQRWALREITAAAAALPAGGGGPLRIGMNVSAAHVAERTLVDDVAGALSASGLAPERLVLEVTESTVLAEGDSVAVDAEALRLMGVHVALDDFGTGSSSLGLLTRLPVDVLKLDRSFVSRVDRDRQSRALCEAVVTVGRSLGLQVVAEGVETPAQLGALRGLGVDQAQGFLLSRPLPLADLVRLLRDGAGQLWPGLVGSSADPVPPVEPSTVRAGGRG